MRSTDLQTWEWAGTDFTGRAGVPDGVADHDAMPVRRRGRSWRARGRPMSSSGRRTRPTSATSYYTAKSLDASPYGGKQCVGIATAASPDGPFVDHATAPVLCNTAANGTIDPSPFVASDGSVYLSYADDTGIRSQRLSASGLSLGATNR